MSEKTADIVNVVEKSRLEEQDGQVWKETWTEIEIQSPEDKISEDMADYLWYEFGVEAEKEGIEVAETDE